MTALRADEPVGQVDALSVPRFAGLRTFARLPSLSEVGRADVAVLGAPFDGAATFRSGARFGPSAIREASLLLKPYNEDLRIAPFAALQVVDAGDAPASPIAITAAHQSIELAARAVTEAGGRVVGLGGDHSVTLPLLRAAAAAHGPLCLLHLDGHSDSWDSYFGSRYTHGTILRRAAEEGIIDPQRSVQVGLRGPLYAAGDVEENRALGFTPVMARDFDSIGVAGVLDVVKSHLRSPVYVTVDVDVLDPAYAPGTGTPEPGGLTSRELIAFLGYLGGLKLYLAGGDIVEVSPPYDPAGVTATVAANIAYHLVGLMALTSRA
jgi:agmatinase